MFNLFSFRMFSCKMGVVNKVGRTFGNRELQRFVLVAFIRSHKPNRDDHPEKLAPENPICHHNWSMVSRHLISLQHPLVKRLVKLRESRSFRQEEGEVLIV